MLKKIVFSIVVLVALFALKACLDNDDTGAASGITQAVDDGSQPERPQEPAPGEEDDVSLPVALFSGFPNPVPENVVEVREDYITNLEAPVPPQCYTKTEQKHNPCYVCHQLYPRGAGSEYRMNKLDDGGLQGGYLFSDVGVTNHWQNLFEDKTEWVEAISDEDILRYINKENYSSLEGRLQQQGWQGFIPDLENYQAGEAAFGEYGIAKDGSGWVAFNYKPFPSTFWPTNGSTDDVLIRLPEKFRTLNGNPSNITYLLNLSLVEITLKELPEIDIPPVEETVYARDLNGDGQILGTVTVLKAQESYLADANSVQLLQQQYPYGTEFMHSVRYVGVSDNGEIVVPPRMKELRYMQKIRELSDEQLDSRYWKERKEKFEEELPGFVNHNDKGFENGLGWLVHGFIEDEQGELRPQSFEERMFCMGCHSAIGTTIDQTFAFGRKVTGLEGWGYIDLRGMKDSPSVSSDIPEVLEYLKRVGGGNEFRENEEIRERWFNPDGSVKEQAVMAADVYTLITPSVERALELNKAYTHIVRHQDYIYGRDANIKPAVNVFYEVDESEPPLKAEHQIYGWDLRLDWN